MSRRRLWCVLALLAGAGALSTGWRGIGPAGLLIAAAIFPLVLVGAAMRARLPAWVAASIPIVVGGGGVLAAAALGNHLALWSEPGRAVRDLLAAPHPAPAQTQLLLPGLLLCIVTGTVVGVRLEVARRGSVAGLAGGVVLYLAAQLLAAGNADRAGLLAASLIAVALLGWLTAETGAGPREGGRYRGPQPTHLAAAVALVGVVPVALAGLGSAGGFQPRDHVTLPRTTVSSTDPLSLLQIWTSHPQLQLITAEAHGTDRLHVATLGRYDGTSWQPSGSFQPLDAYSAPDLPLAGLTTNASATIRVVRLGGPLLPTAGATHGLSQRAGLVDPSSGDIALTSGVVPGLTYTVSGQRETPTPAELSAATVPIVPSVYLTVPTPPAGLLAYAKQVTADATTPLQQAVALEAAISQDRTLTVTAPGGSSYARILTFLFRPASEGGQVGTTEQFATSFALLARLVGLPSRLVVGFALPSSSPQPQPVIGKDARAWPEVYLGGAGWVAFDPTPGAVASADATVRKEVLTDVDNAAKRRAAIQKQLPAPRSPTTATPVARPAAPGGSIWPQVAVVVGFLVILALVAVVVSRLRRRSRRRRAGSPGAWAEVLGLVRRLDRRPAPGESATSIASGFGEISAQAGQLARGIATAAEAAVFAGEARSGNESWQQLRTLRREVRQHVPLRHRLPVPRR